MARYDRFFLVPYLRDICVLHLSKDKVQGMIESANREIERIQRDALRQVLPPELEEYKGPNDTYGIGYGCGGCACALMAAILFVAALMSGDAVMLVLPGMFVIAGIALMHYSLGEKDRENERIRERNNEKERDHALAEIAALVVMEPEIDEIKKQIDVYHQEINKIDGLLKALYGANVIPGWYRDLYSAVYLNDWFSNGRSDDMDMALNTFVLEQIKDKLDIIICNQAEELLYQRIMIANQRNAMEQRAWHHREMMAKLEEMQLTEEERNTYMSMMNANIAADAYFSAANYLKK